MGQGPLWGRHAAAMVCLWLALAAFLAELAGLVWAVVVGLS
jgi:hypothetical protein